MTSFWGFDCERLVILCKVNSLRLINIVFMNGGLKETTKLLGFCILRL